MNSVADTIAGTAFYIQSAALQRISVWTQTVDAEEVLKVQMHK